MMQSDECLNYFLDYNKVLKHESTQFFVALRPGGIEPEKVSALLTDKLLQQNIPTVSIVSLVPPTTDYYTFDGHWNKEGNKIAAEAIYNLLEENKGDILKNLEQRKHTAIFP